MASLKTKLLFAHVFVGLVESRPVDQVTVSDLVEAAQKNRKTFYYHFADKRELGIWIFRYDLANQLRLRVDEENLVFQEERESGTADMTPFPYYTHIRVGIRTLDAAPFYRSCAAVLEGRRAYYRQMLRCQGDDGLSEYLFNLFEPALRRDIGFILGGRQLEERHQRFLSEFYTGAFIDYLTRRLLHADGPILADAGPFSNIIQTSIAEEIRKQQQMRSL